MNNMTGAGLAETAVDGHLRNLSILRGQDKFVLPSLNVAT